MKFNLFKFSFLLLIIGILSSCFGTETTTTSSDASFVSLTFAANDSIPYLNTAKFSLDGDGKTIVNIDSLPFKTRVDSVNPTFSFKSTAGTILYFDKSVYKYNKDSALITGKDTIDFRNPVGVRNYASDGKTYLRYNVKVNVHKVDPELYIWTKASDKLSSINALSQKTILFNNTFFYYLNDGTNGYLYNSTDGNSWNTAVVNGLPTNTPLTDLTQFNSKLFVTQDGYNIYSSTNGFTWVKKSTSEFTFKSLLFGLNGKLWAVVQAKSDLSYHFANSADGDIWTMLGEIPNSFPLNDFASITFSTVTGKSKGVVVGGVSTSGFALRTSWSTEDGNYWVNFSTENNSLEAVQGASVIRYDNKLLLFGQVDAYEPIPVYQVSIDEGLSWQTPDTLRNKLPKSYTSRRYGSVVVYNNKIYITGGKSGSTVYTDLWIGMLNRKKFIRQ